MPKRNLFVLIMMVVTAVVAWLARDRVGHGRRFAEVLGAIERTYLEPVDQQSLFDAAMEGVFSRLDEHSAFVVGDRRDQLESLLDQEFGGVGLELAKPDPHGGIAVVSPVFGSPAWHAGIVAGDQILAIDGVSTLPMPLIEAFRRLRGRPGAAVLLSVASPLAASSVAEGADGSARDIALVREIVRTESVLGDRRHGDGTWEWMVEGEPGGDDGAPVATLCAIGPAVVELFGNELVPEARDGARPDRACRAVGANRRAGEAVARQRWHDHVEGVTAFKEKRKPQFKGK